MSRHSFLISCWWQWKEQIYVFLKLLGWFFFYFWVNFLKRVSPLHLKTDGDVLAVTHQFYWSMLPLYIWFVFAHALMLLLISLSREPNALLMFWLLQDIRKWVIFLAELLLMKNGSCGIKYILKRMMMILQLYHSLTCWWLSIKKNDTSRKICTLRLFSEFGNQWRPYPCIIQSHKRVQQLWAKFWRNMSWFVAEGAWWACQRHYGQFLTHLKESKDYGVLLVTLKWTQVLFANVVIKLFPAKGLARSGNWWKQTLQMQGFQISSGAEIKSENNKSYKIWKIMKSSRKE